MNSVKTNWLRFTSFLAADVINHDIKPLTENDRVNVFIIDDTMFQRTGCKKTELASRVFDHVEMSFKKGYRLLTLGWSDGNTYIPVNSFLLASAKESNILGPVIKFDKRSVAGQRRKMAQGKATDVMLTLIDKARSCGITADYVLFDSWYANPAQITSLKSKGLDVIAMIKKSIKIKYEYNSQKLNIKQIYAKNKKRRGRSKYLLSVDVKSTLNLIGECHSLSYDALTAHIAVVFARYMLLTVEQRKNEDPRTLGEIFFFLADEMSDITFSRSFYILIEAMLASMQELFKLTEKQISEFMEDFENRLPKYIQESLQKGQQAV